VRRNDEANCFNVTDCFTAFAMTSQFAVIAREEWPKQSAFVWRITSLRS